MDLEGSWHPNVRGKYWNDQAFQYIIGINKPYSTDDSERCLKKAIDYGDYAAMYNLCNFMDAGIIEMDQRLYDKLQSQLSHNDNRMIIDDEMKDQLVASELRKALEQKMMEIVGPNQYCSGSDTKAYRLFNAIKYASERGLISNKQYQVYSDIRQWSGSKLHADGNTKVRYNPDWCKLFNIEDKINHIKNM